MEYMNSQPSMAEIWESRYATSSRVWSGRPNATLTQIAPTLKAGRSLDLGCGEGADVIWLASQGWDAMGVDISPTAVQRATDAAHAAGLSGVRFESADLNTWGNGERFDLVTAFFFHSRMEPDRAHILRRAASQLAPGGHLLLVSHAHFPPWAPAAEQSTLSPDQEVAELDLDPYDYTTVIAETRNRPATSPNDEPGALDDVVVLISRKV